MTQLDPKVLNLISLSKQEGGSGHLGSGRDLGLTMVLYTETVVYVTSDQAFGTFQ